MSRVTEHLYMPRSRVLWGKMYFLVGTEVLKRRLNFDENF